MEQSLKLLAKEAKRRLKSGFWAECHRQLSNERTYARESGMNEGKVERYFAEKVSTQIKGEKEDDFYLKVKELILSEGEVSDAIGRLTDREYYDSLDYTQKQRYTLELSERYLRALERFKREYEYEIKGRKG